MSLADHLKELRRRLLIAVASLLIGMIIAFFITDTVIAWLTQPINEVAALRDEQERVGLMFDAITGPFDLRLRIALAIGLLLSAPVWLWQIWAFLMPGLTRKEIRYSIGFVAAAVPLFFGGCFIGWLIMPHIVELMAGFTPSGAANWYQARIYYDFVFKLLLATGIACVLPVFLVALNLAGVMSGRDILKGWRVAVLVATLFAGVATPAADVVSMLILAGILITLYFAAAGISLLFDRRRRVREARALGLAS